MGRKRGFKKNSTMCCTMRHDKCHGLAKIVYLVLWHVNAGWFCFLWIWSSIWSLCPFWVLQESVTASLISSGWLPEITCVALQHWSCPSNPLPCSARLSIECCLSWLCEGDAVAVTPEPQLTSPLFSVTTRLLGSWTGPNWAGLSVVLFLFQWYFLKYLLYCSV